MVRLVSLKNDGVGDGSATPSPTPKPKVTNWEQVEERQQRNRGAQPRRPTPKTPIITATPDRPASGAATPPAVPTDPTATSVLKGEIPAGNPIGRTAVGMLNPEVGSAKPWKQQFRDVTAPVYDGRGGLVVNGASRFGTAVVNGTKNTLSAYGSIDPTVPYRTGGKFSKGLALAMLGAQIVGGGAATEAEIEGGKNALINAFVSSGYPKDVAETMATAYLGAAAPTRTVTDTVAGAAGDATFMAATSAAGAGIGALFFGIGAVPGAIIGAGFGWTAGRIAAGASTLLNMVEAATGSDIPTINDYWIHGALYEKSGQTAHDAGMIAAANSVKIYGDRFLSDEDTYAEEEKIKSGHYAQSTDVDPKYDDYFKFIQEGYFVKQDVNGRYYVNVEEVQDYLINTARLTREEDLRQFLPKKTSVGDAFYKSKRLTDDMLAGMWDTAGVMP